MERSQSKEVLVIAALTIRHFLALVIVISLSFLSATSASLLAANFTPPAAQTATFAMNAAFSGVSLRSAAVRLSPYDVSIVEARGVPAELTVPWLLPPQEAYLPGLLIADLALLRKLEAGGVSIRILGEYIETKLYYLVQASPFVSERTVSGMGAILWSNGDSYLIAADEEIEYKVRALGFHVNLLLPIEKSVASIAPVLSLPLPMYSPVENFWINQMVGAVSQSDISDYLNSLTGEKDVNLAGGPDTILTRYSYHPDRGKAAEYIYGQFDSMGISVTYDYYFGVPLRCVAFEGLEGYTVGGGGTIFHTEDGGDSWEKQNSGTNKTLSKVSLIAQDSAWVCGSVGTVLRTFDGGSSWDSLLTGIWYYLYGIKFVNALEGWICSEGGIVKKTVNGGLNWFEQSTGTLERLYEIEFVDSQHGWAVGGNGGIIHTSDGGDSWSAQTSGVSSRLADVCFIDSLNGWAVGYGGTIVHTSDGGSTWETQSSGVVNYLLGVCFTDSLHGWTVGVVGLVLYTEDGGTHWSTQQSGTGSPLYSVCFTDTLRGWAAGTSSIIRTEDGGLTWSSLNENISDKWSNVVATLTGTSTPSQTYVVCGHYDSISDDPMTRAPGADDNASGTSLVLEAASILKDFAFLSSIRFICFSGEEQGLIGSNHYAGDAFSAGEDIAGVLNFDMVGYGTPNAYLIGNNPSEWLVDYCVAVRDSFVPWLDLTKQINGNMRWSDHAPFWDRGYSALCGIEVDYGSNPYYHSTSDTVGNLTISFAADVTRLAVASLASVAGLDTASVAVPPEALVASHISLGRSYPNPFNPYTYIPFTLPATIIPTNYVLAIFDPTGRIVKILEEGSTSEIPLERRAIWDGTDESGGQVASGVYLCYLSCGEESRAQKIVLIR